MSSLDRLIDLAKRTGDRLIVHDPIEGCDVVILDVDEYERLVLNKKERQEDELDRVFSDDYGDDWQNQPEDWRSQPEDWHTAGSVLEDRYGSHNWPDEEEELSDDDIKIEDIPDFGPNFEPEKINAVPFQAQENTEVWKEEPLLEEEPVFYEEPV